jgi:NAD(P)-dependent dehydrogenase (short-subunit alcohol dehydrogenase family)
MSSERVILVSGGTYGIGQAVSLKFAERGDRVTAFGVGKAQSKGTQAAAGERGLQIRVLTEDVSQLSAARRVVSDVIEREGRVDVLVNNAAIRPLGTILETTEENWDRTFAVNVRGMFLLTREVLPHMIARRKGVIINVGSGAGYGRPGRFAYSVSKGAIFPFTMALALDYAKDGIRVNTVVPGGVHPTGMTENEPETVLKLSERAKTASPAGRLNSPEDVANAIVWLASDEASTITGSTLEVVIRS